VLVFLKSNNLGLLMADIRAGIPVVPIQRESFAMTASSKKRTKLDCAVILVERFRVWPFGSKIQGRDCAAAAVQS